ncbi:MAG: cation:proton antiporter subunit C [Verrucomicrobiae bacterium]|nr:cation:proton antiporter subunit C [Verrucomicrobiae bacterium]
MVSFFQEAVVPHFNFWIYVIIMMIGLWAVIAKNNLVKKLIGLSIFQTAILLLYVSLAVKEDAGIPILDHHAVAHVGEPEGAAAEAAGEPGKQHAGEVDTHGNGHPAIDPDRIANPLPHVLMLTAIVVGVATLGVALALCQMIYKDFGTLEEDEVLQKIKSLHDDV